MQGFIEKTQAHSFPPQEMREHRCVQLSSWALGENVSTVWPPQVPHPQCPQPAAGEGGGSEEW